MLYLANPDEGIIAVDMKQPTWKTIHLLEPIEPVYSSNITFIGKSQRCMHVNNRSRNYYVLIVWTLKGDEKWIYKCIMSPKF
jgi:hypothetical protein